MTNVSQKWRGVLRRGRTAEGNLRDILSENKNPKQMYPEKIRAGKYMTANTAVSSKLSLLTGNPLTSEIEREFEMAKTRMLSLSLGQQKKDWRKKRETAGKICRSGNVKETKNERVSVVRTCDEKGRGFCWETGDRR